MDLVKQEEDKANILTDVGVVALDWLELPEHVTSIILSKLSSSFDSARFGAVCVQWLSIFHTHINEDCPKSFIPPQLPLLMIPTQPVKKKKNKKRKRWNDSSSSTISCSFYRVTDGKIFNALLLAMPRDRYVCGSGHGWLVTVDQDEICYSVQLINPFFYPNTSTKEIKLPPLTAQPFNNPERVSHYRYLRKAVLSADPISNPKDFIVMAIFGDYTRLSFCKSGDKAWTPIRDNTGGSFDDVIYYNGKFYAVHSHGTVVVCNVANCTTIKIAGPLVTEFISRTKYLVISSGQLLQVHRNVDKDGITIGFKVFKLQKPSQNTDWVEVKDLYGHVLFLGDNASISISASDFPGCKPNSIYYTDDNIKLYWREAAGNGLRDLGVFNLQNGSFKKHYPRENAGKGPRDLGVFNLQNGSFEKHYPIGVYVQIWPAPIWIEPTLQRSAIHTDQ